MDNLERAVANSIAMAKHSGKAVIIEIGGLTVFDSDTDEA